MSDQEIKSKGQYPEILAGEHKVDEEIFVRFRLLYSGNQLTSNGTPSNKHAIRRDFHLQLKQLWSSKPKLLSLAHVYGGLYINGREEIGFTKEEAREAYFNHLGSLYERGGFRFVPLVTEELKLDVKLDILFLRPDSHPLIYQGGDLDNRLKTLFDSLQVPGTTSGLGGAPEEDEDPFFVLLEDDQLINEFSVSTDALLMLPHQRALDAKDTFLVIDVKISIRERTARGMTFE